jgi:O-acetyl-ADP-ribose deacetylase (regulator of RNase III)
MITKTKFHNTELEVIQGDIANQTDLESVVNAANAQLKTGGGVAGAIHRAAGPGLADECSAMAPIKAGEAVISGAHDLPNKFVIHCLGPVYGRDEPEEELLADCYRKSLQLADENNIDSIAFPAISTGAFGYPFKAATDTALNAVKAVIPQLKSVKKIRFVLFSESDYKYYLEGLEKVFG